MVGSRASPTSTLSFEQSVDRAHACPACTQPRAAVFYSLDPVPVNSCVLAPTREEALAFPTGTLRLAACPGCGFIFNTAFDPALQQYGARYEETQGFSPTFRAFAADLAVDWARRFDLAGKTVVEIGCGKGEFLSLLCSVSGARGIGFDPLFQPGRAGQHADNRDVEFVNDLYGPEYSYLDADFICCRHTLEHIPDVGRFARDLRASIGDRAHAAVAFELPDTLRILRAGAFWDLYYEHCSYFTPGSLARLFRAAGFDVTGLRLAYSDQYIILEARPSSAAAPPTTLDLEDGLETCSRAVAGFAAACRPVLDAWRSRLQAWKQAGESAVLWGSGSKAVGFLTTLGDAALVEHVVDINPHKRGTFMPPYGQEIVAPEFLRRHPPRHVVAMNPVYTPEIEADLRRLGVGARLWSL